VAERYPGYRHFLDFDGTVGRLYGALPQDAGEAGAKVEVRRFWIVLDPTLRVLRAFPFQPDRGDIDAVMAYVASLPPPGRFAGIELQAPVILLPNVLEEALCRRLVDTYEASGGEPSGFMRQIDGKTMLVHDPNHKRRRDCDITDREMIAALQARVRRRIVPEIAKVHQFHVTRMERYIVACYSAEEAGHFQAHRDNTTSGTAHRRFAVSINLNGEFEGGEIYFPEYGMRSFKPPVGGAVIFSCSLLHAVTPVTAGKRYAFLPFLYDDAAARQREANNQFLSDGIGAYSAGSAAGA
jgi:predicted 2-oxoglutarate/Fe(II)-dependent dioxygenase YbiX